MKDYIIFKMIKYFQGDAKRINHALKVAGYANAITAAEHITGLKKEIIEIAAILHDVGIKVAEEKYNSKAGKYQELEGPPVARKILENLEISEDIIGRVCYLIGNHHSYQKIDDIDFQILVEADLIVNIFEGNGELGSIQKVYTQYFKTDSGKEIMEEMYL